MRRRNPFIYLGLQPGEAIGEQGSAIFSKKALTGAAQYTIITIVSVVYAQFGRSALYKEWPDGCDEILIVAHT